MKQWYLVWARGHHGFPQPEDGYSVCTYRNWCARCGQHDEQIAPFRVRRALAGHSHFLQLNWQFDVFFVSSEVGARIVSEGISGVDLGPVLEHKSSREMPERQQLMIRTIAACAETSKLPRVTCQPKNEESAYDAFGIGEKRYPTTAPYCGRVKHHAPTTLAVDPIALFDAPDLVLTAEWFGSGGSAFRLV
ncbi:MAG TPA: hypothetical protein VFW45_16040, partial [Candidatus Polarisedimenticolia bacterium]|nr:hypothetical protein [Candidatus Polarisedimenticolia bacterium]